MSENEDSDSSAYSGLGEEEESSDENDDQSLNDETESIISQENGNAIEKEDEYAQDSSDEEDLRNTVGNIPMHWYDDYPHIGYDLSGKQIIKPIQGDEIDEFMKKMDDPNYWRTVKDPQTGQNIILSDDDLQLIKNIQKSRYPGENYDPYEPFEDFFTYKTMIHPVTNQPEHKRSFIPSKIEKEKVSKMVHAIKMGWMKPKQPKKKSRSFFLLWDDNEQSELNLRMQRYIAAPKMQLPGHAESYNPPPEYLLTKEEEEKWLQQEPEMRKMNFLPKKYSSLRLVPGYENFIKERFERCLDLYLCPRQVKMKVNVDPEDLIPKLPKPQDLQPFPTILSIVYEGHKDVIRCLSVEPAGQFFASGSDDQSVRIWEVLTGRCVKIFNFDSIIKSLAWCPNSGVSLIAVASGNFVYILNPGTGDKNINNETDSLLHESSRDENGNPLDGESSKCDVSWSSVKIIDNTFGDGFRIIINHQHLVEQVTWHAKGDYFSTVTLTNSNQAVLIHQLSSRKTQAPFKNSKGLVQKVLFHPARPYFFVATQKHVRIYNLVKQQLTKKLLCNCKWLSSIAIHPLGDNIIIGSYDSRLTWFDLDLSVKPYNTLRHHKKAIRQVTYHKKYPLFASASDDGSVIICHGMVYNDLLQNPLIVPVKVLRGHQTTKDMGVLDCQFHPTQPWVFSAGADAKVHLYT